MLYLAYSIGKNDSQLYCKKMKLTNPIEILSAGLIHLSYTGNYKKLIY